MNSGVHAKDDAARQWYLNWEFEPSETDPFHLFLLLKDLKAMLLLPALKFHACWIDPAKRSSHREDFRD